MPPFHRRPLEDYFKPKSSAAPIIPQKRPSPSSTKDENVLIARKPVPKTPVKQVHFKDVTPNSIKSLYLSPLSQSSLPIRSPRPQATPSPSKHRQTTLFEDRNKSPPKEPKLNTSFTFSDVSERSQKVIEGGKVVAVRDSDEDSDSLQSLDEIFGRKKDGATTSDSSPPEDTEAERIKTLSMFTSGRSVPIVGKDKLRALYAKERAAKFDLSTVLDDHFDDEESEHKIKRMRAGFDGTKDEDEGDHLDKHLLASVVRTSAADDEDVERLLYAVERTEALSTTKKFSFFDLNVPSHRKRPPKQGFPSSSIPDEMWEPKDRDSQDQAYLSGYMADLAACGGLTDEAVRWTYDQVINEPSAELRHAYICCLKASSKVWTRLNITAADVQSAFYILGADADCIRDASPVKPKYQPVQEQLEPDYQHLLSILELFQALCADMDFLALSKLSSILVRLTLDKSVMSDRCIHTATQSILETLLSLPDEETRNHIYDRLLKDATEHLHDPQLQVQLLSHIPPSCPTAIELRKSLADIFLLGPSILNPHMNKANATLAQLSEYLSKSPSFSLTRHAQASSIDYAAMTAQTQILNIAISSGNPPIAASEAPNLSATSILLKSQRGESAFNASVDIIADKLHNLFVSIKDTGASHMRRTEAKDALQALYFRLLFSVRTRARKKKHVFDSNGAMKGGSMKARWVSGDEFREKERAGEFMKQFLARREMDVE